MEKKKLKFSLKHLFKRTVESFGNLCYYPGCLTRFVLPGIEKNYIAVLRSLSIDVITIPDEMQCCGAPILNAGYRSEFVDHKDKLLGYFKSHGVTRIVSSCPTCSHFVGKHHGLTTEHITELLDKKLVGTKLTKIGEGKKIAYHDPCHLGRYSDVYDEPRRVIALLGYEVIELPDNKEKALCCGAGAGLRNSRPGLSKDIAKKRLEQLSLIGVDTIVTCCPMCYVQLQENASSSIKVYELSQLLVQALGIEDAHSAINLTQNQTPADKNSEEKK